MFALVLGSTNVPSDGVNIAAACVLHQRCLLFQVAAVYGKGLFQDRAVGDQRKLHLQRVLTKLLVKQLLPVAGRVTFLIVQPPVIELQIVLLGFDGRQCISQRIAPGLEMSLPHLQLLLDKGTKAEQLAAQL